MLLLSIVLACAQKGDPAPSSVADVADISTAPAERGLMNETEFAQLHTLTTEQAPPHRGRAVMIGEMEAYLSLPEGAEGPVPGVVVVHEWWGLNEHIRHWTDRLAGLGYAALAVDLYGGTVATTREGALAAMKAVDEAQALANLKAAHAFLQEDARVRAPKTASIGWCFGGGWSLRLALAEPELDAAVVYYGRLVSDEAALKGLQAPLLGVFGERDGGIPVDAVRGFEQQLQSLGKSVDIRLFDAEHAFANPSSGRYDAASAGAAWEAVKPFLAAHLE